MTRKILQTSIALRAMQHPRALTSALLGLTCLSGIFMGIGIILSGHQMLTSPIFAAAVAIAPPSTWGLVFIFAGTFVGIGAKKGYEAAETATLVLALLFAAWAACIAASAVPVGLYAGLVAYMALSALSALTSLACGALARENRSLLEHSS